MSTLALVCAVLLSVALAPSLWSDWQMRNQELTETNSVYVEKASCNVRLFVSFCEISVREKTFPVFYLITGFDTGKSLNILQPKNAAATLAVAHVDTKTPPVFTTDIGMTYFWNRFTTFIASFSLALSLGIATMLGKVRGL
jgi:hypothetical protein